MAVKFAGAGTQYIKFTAPTNALGLTSKTIHLKYYHNANPADVIGTLWFIFDGTGTDADEYNYLIILGSAPLKLSFMAHFSTTNGVWNTTNNVLTVGAWHDIIVTYNGSATGNNPVIYVNGVSVAVTRATAPVGTYRSGTSADMYLGDITADYTANGNIEDLRIYNVIKTAAQAAAIASEDLLTDQSIDESGLVFHAPLMMCQGQEWSTFAGSTLEAANEFLDRVNGYVGVPTGDPEGA